MRVLVDGAWGFASSSRLDRPRRIASPRWRCASRVPPPRHAAAPRPARRSAARPRDATRRPSWRIPSPCPWTGRSATSSAADAAMAPRRPGSASPKVRYDAQREWKTYAGQRRLADRAGRSPTSGRASRPMPSTATTCSAAATRNPAATGRRLRVHPRPGPRRQRRAGWPRRPWRCWPRPQLPARAARTIILHPSQLYLQIHESCGHPTELDRVFGTEASYAGTSFLTHGQAGARSATARTWSTSSPTPPRPAAWAPSAGTTRASPRSACRSSSDGVFSGLPDQPRDRAAHRPPAAAGPCAPTAGTACRSSA